MGNLGDMLIKLGCEMRGNDITSCELVIYAHRSEESVKVNAKKNIAFILSVLLSLVFMCNKAVAQLCVVLRLLSCLTEPRHSHMW